MDLVVTLVDKPNILMQTLIFDFDTRVKVNQVCVLIGFTIKIENEGQGRSSSN